MYTCNYGNEPMDLKLLFLKLMRRIYIPILAAVIGAVVCGGVYYLDTFVFVEKSDYTATSKFYIDYQELEKNADEVYVYFNEYTWNNLLKNDIILGYVMSYLAGDVMQDGVTGQAVPNAYRTEEYLNASVSCRLLSDTRILTVTVVSDDPEISMKIASAYECAIPVFAATTKEIKEIRILLKGDSATQVKINNLTYRAVMLGAISFCIIALFLMLMEFILDDSVYFPTSAEQRFGYPVFGVLFSDKHKAEAWYTSELSLNLQKLKASEMKAVVLCEDREEEISNHKSGNPTLQEELKKAGIPILYGIQYDPMLLEQTETYDEVILAFACGKHNGKRMERTLNLIDKQEIKVGGLILTGADSSLYRQYFWPKRPETRKGGTGCNT